MGFFRKPDIDALLAKGDLEGLIRALESERDSEVRRDVAVALGATGDAKAAEPLIQALKDQSWRVRSEAASALGELADSRAVEPLGILALKDEEPDVRETAVQFTVAAALDEMGYGHLVIL